ERGGLRVEVDDAPVRMLWLRHPRRPEMQRDGAEIDYVQEGVDVLADEEVDVPATLLAPDSRGPDPRGNVIGSILLEEALAGDPVGISRQYYGAVAKVREQPRRDRAVVIDQVTLGVTLLGPEDLVQVAERDFARQQRHGRRPRLDAFGGRLVAAEPEERRLSQEPVLGDLLVTHLDHQLRLHPGVPAAAGKG